MTDSSTRLTLQFAEHPSGADRVVVEDPASDVEQLADERVPQRVSHGRSLLQRGHNALVPKDGQLLRDDRLPFLVEQLDTLIGAGDDPSTAEVDVDSGQAVHVLTYHRAKGLEFPVVFMVGLVEDRFPSRDRRDALALPASGKGEG